MTKTVDEAIAEHGALTVCIATGMEPGVTSRMTALGLAAPKTMRDVWEANKAAYAALNCRERSIYDRETTIALAYLGAACRGGVAPRHTPAAYTAQYKAAISAMPPEGRP